MPASASYSACRAAPAEREHQPGCERTDGYQRADCDEQERPAVVDDDDVAQAERLPGRVDELAARARALVGPLCQRVAGHGVERRRKARVMFARLGRRLLQVPPEDGEVGTAGVRRLARQTLVQDAAERVHIGAAIAVAALDHLGSRVGGRADGVDPLLSDRSAPASRLLRPKSAR